MAEEGRQTNLFDDELFDEQASHLPFLEYPRQAKSRAPFVKRLWLERLKGFERLEIEFGAFNVLVGPNNCGKSTILQAINLCFRLIQLQVEFQRGVLVQPRTGKKVLNEILPVAVPEDFWFQGKYRMGNERIPVKIGVELEGDLEFEFEIKGQYGGVNSRMTKFPEGMEEIVLRDILARRPTLVPSSVGVVIHEEWRVPARLELLSMTGHNNEILRNFLYDLSNKGSSNFQGLQNDLRKHFGGTIGPIKFSREKDQYIAVYYQEKESKHDIFSAGSGFLQVLQLLTYLYLQTPGIVLLDEPDAHLHSSLQKLVVDLLEGLSKREKLQVIMATHSKEIINYVDTSHILPISRNQHSAQSLEHHASVLPILQDLGAIDNADLAALIASKRCVFLEGDTDKTLLAHFAAKLSSTVFEGQSQVVAIHTKGIDHPEKYLNLDIFEQVVGKPIRALIIRDRDGLPDELVKEIQANVNKPGREVLCLTKTHIENYLLMPTVIWRVLCDELRKRNADDKNLPTTEQVETEIERVVDALHDDTFDSVATQINKHYIAYRKKHLETNTANQEARPFLNEKWKTLEGKLSIVLGKDALKAIRLKIQEKWKVSFNNIRLVEAMTAEEIDPEVKEIIKKLEAL